MSLRRVLLRLYHAIRPARGAREAAREVAAHLDLLAEEFERRGLRPDEARRAARRAFGGVDQAIELHRDARAFTWIEDARRDVGYAARTLRRTPAFAGVAILTLALGIGANTAIFSLIDALMLAPLPVPSPRELFAVQPLTQGRGRQRVSYPAFLDLQQALHPRYAGAAMTSIARLNTTAGSGDVDTTAVQLVSGEYFSVLGLAAARGRLLAPSDNRTIDGHPVAVISDGFWRRRLGGDASAIGRPMTISGSPFTIVGVAPRGFTGVWADAAVDVWVPLVMQATVKYRQNYSSSNADETRPWTPQARIQWLDVIGRAPRREHPAAAARLDAAYRASLARAFDTPGAERRRPANLSLTLVDFDRGFSSVRGRYATPLVILMALVASVLLAACGNLANLLLARATAREREIAVRLAMGAGRGRLVRQLLIESLLLSAIGGAAGVVIAAWTGGVIVNLAGMSRALARPALPLVLRAFGFAAALAVTTALIVGLAPALRATRVDVLAAFRAGGGSLFGRSGRHGMKAILALQVALSIVLLVCAALFGRTLGHLYAIDPGFDAAHLLTVRLDHRVAGYDGDRTPQLYVRLVDAIRTLPGVETAAIASCDVVSDCRATVGDYDFEDYRKRPGERVDILENRVGADYFRTIGLPVVEGRAFDARDTSRSPKVAVINRAMARQFFRGAQAAGRRFRHRIERDEEYEVIGVVPDARVTSLREDQAPMVYFPVTQAPLRPFGGGVEVRAASPARIAGAVRTAIGRVDPALPIARLETVDELIGNTFGRERLIAYLATAFSALALLLASVGLFGVTSYGVSRRTRELGVRMALGASRFTIISTVLADALVWVGVGVGLGLAAAIAASRMLASTIAGLLFDVRPSDPIAFALAPLALVAVAAVAAYFPARRASRIDPLIALRAE